MPARGVASAGGTPQARKVLRLRGGGRCGLSRGEGRKNSGRGLKKGRGDADRLLMQTHEKLYKTIDVSGDESGKGAV